MPTRAGFAISLLVVSAAAGASACGKTDTAAPVATVTLSANRTRLTPGSPVELTYQFVLAPGAHIESDYRVFTQVVDAEGHGTSWNDDHAPSIPTSTWKPGDTVKYTRTSFAPVIPYLGEVSVQVGLYRGQDRLPLQTQPAPATPAKGRAYEVAKFQFVPATEGDNLFIVRRGGWNQSEYPNGMQWTWTQKSAVFGLEANPKRDVVLYLQYDARPEVFDKPQQVTLSLGSTVLDKFVADTSEIRLLKVPVTAAQFGTGEVPAQFTLAVDRTFVPSKLTGPAQVQDDRELGLRVYHCVIEGR